DQDAAVQYQTSAHNTRPRYGCCVRPRLSHPMATNRHVAFPAGVVRHDVPAPSGGVCRTEPVQTRRDGAGVSRRPEEEGLGQARSGEGLRREAVRAHSAGAAGGSSPGTAGGSGALTGGVAYGQNSENVDGKNLSGDSAKVAVGVRMAAGPAAGGGGATVAAPKDRAAAVVGPATGPGPAPGPGPAT